MKKTEKKVKKQNNLEEKRQDKVKRQDKTGQDKKR